MINDLDRKIDGRPIRIAVWDLETTGLNSDFGYILTSGIRDFRTGKVTMLRIDDKRNPDKTSDKWVVKETIKILDSYDLIITWYGIKFDHPFLDTRAALHKLKFQDRNYRRDLWYSSRSRFKLRSNRLAVVGEFLFGKSGKNSITPKYWNKAIRGEKEGMDYVAHHNYLDLLETAKVYKRMMPLFAERLRKSGS